MTSPATWAADFKSLSAFHAVSLAIFCGSIGVSLLLGRKWRGSPAERRLRLGWGIFIVLFQILTIVHWFLPANFEIQTSLPLHVCDLVVWAAALSMLTPSRVGRVLTYFFGVGLSTQGFLTPTLQVGYADLEYWLFWIGHTQIIGTGIYLIVVDGYRPSIRDLRLAIFVGLAYVAVMATFDALTGLNYGYVGPVTPDVPTLIDRLGPWPGRVFLLVGIVITLFVLMWGVWPLARRLRKATHPE